MKAQVKKGKIEFTIQYSDYARREIETAAAALGMEPVGVCITAHRLMISIAATEPALFLSMVKHFQDGVMGEMSN